MTRQKTLEDVRNWLDGRQGQWIVTVRLTGSLRPWRLIWYASGEDRGRVWKQLDRILSTSPGDGEIRIRQAGSSRNQSVVFPWPCPDAQEVSPSAIPGLTVRLVDLAVRSKKYSPQCARAILKVLYETQKRHTAMDLVLALEHSKDHHGWCQATTEASACHLRREGFVDNLRDGRGTGYGLVNWDVDPLGGEE